MPANTEHTAIVQIIMEAAHSLGATVLLEPEWRCVGNIIYPSGSSRFFRLSTLDLNTMGASEVARDKDYARFFLKEKNYPIADGKTFFSQKWCETIGATDRTVDHAWKYARDIGLPVYVKPNSLSRGVGVARVTNKKEFDSAARHALRYDKVILIEKELLGRDYRLVVLDGKVISAYERLPLTVTGNGRSSIDELIDAKMMLFEQRGRKTNINKKDMRMRDNLRRIKLTLQSVLAEGRQLRLLDNANLSSGGESVDVTEHIHQEYKYLAAKIAHDMGLRLVGVDLMIDGSICEPVGAGRYWIIEINSAPGLDHYVTMGEEQKRIVADLYRQVIGSMERPGETGGLVARP